jgi:hypothetical protein
MKKTLLAILAAAGVTSGAFAASNTTYSAGDVLLGFRYTDPEQTKAYIVNLGNINTVANYTPAWSGINLSSDLQTVFGANWATTTTWGMLAIAQDRKSWAASTDVAVGGASIMPKSTAFLGTPASNLSSMGTQFVSLTYDTGTATDHGLLNEGVWGDGTDLNWVSRALDNSMAVGSFEAATSSNLDLWVAYGSTFGTTGNPLRSTTADVNTFSVQGGTLQSVPEPSTYALFGVAALILIVAYRRANA